MALILLIILLPLLGSVLLPLLPRSLRGHVGRWALLPPGVCFLLSLTYLPAISRGDTFHYTLSWFPTLGIQVSFWIDGLSLLFALLISGIGVLIIWYSHYYSIEEHRPRFFAYLLFFMGAMLGVVLSSNLIALFVFWELTSISSFLLIGFWHTQEAAVYGARKSLLITSLGGFALLAGIVLLYEVTGTLELPELAQHAEAIRMSSLYPAILGCIVIGACAKSAQFPFHIWLPNAMAAPTPVSAYLHSATMVKAGLFLIARFLPLLSGTQAWMYAVSGIGMLTMLVGAALALQQYDLKALLAYSTISQLGLIMALYGFGTAGGVRAATFHLFNHAAFKGALFLLVGIIEHVAGTRDRRALGGLARGLPVTATLTGIAALAMAGVPLLNGFLSKELFYEASLEMLVWGRWAWVLPELAVVGSLLTVIYALQIFHGVFFGQAPKELANALHDPSAGMLLAPAILAGMCLLMGVFPAPLEALVLAPAVSSIAGQDAWQPLAIWHGFTGPVLMSAVALVGGACLYGYARPLRQAMPSMPVRWPGLSIDALYDRGMAALDRTGLFLMGFLQSGYLRWSLMLLLSVLILSFGVPFIAKAGGALGPLDLGSVEPFEAVLIALLMAGAVAVAWARQPLMAVLTLGLVGLLVSLLFVLLQAPDLALTQLLIETTSLILFLLVLRFLPPFGREALSRWGRCRDLGIAIAVGGLVVVLLLVANSESLYPSIAHYFLEQSLTLGGGRNMVNVIVVDFRGYDTMGEITVLSIAAIGVYALIKLKRG